MREACLCFQPNVVSLLCPCVCRSIPAELVSPGCARRAQATITNPPPKSPNIFSAFSLVHYARTWRKKAKRRFMIVRDM